MKPFLCLYPAIGAILALIVYIRYNVFVTKIREAILTSVIIILFWPLIAVLATIEFIKNRRIG